MTPNAVAGAIRGLQGCHDDLMQSDDDESVINLVFLVGQGRRTHDCPS